MSLLRLFVFEFITGGGLVGQVIPTKLAREGDMMLRAVLRDLEPFTDFQVVYTRDYRLNPLSQHSSACEISIAESFKQTWQQVVSDTDAVWLIAPESDGLLERLAGEVLNQGKLLLGCRPECIALTSSKARCNSVLLKAGIPASMTYDCADKLPESLSGWIVKPDDGVGCDNTFFFPNQDALNCWTSAHLSTGYIIQPYYLGTSLSLSVISDGSDVCILACNEQSIDINNGQLIFRGVIINRYWHLRAEFGPLVSEIVACIRGLRGYFGIDLILTANGPVVIEINPRLTTSYVGLAASLTINPMLLVLPSMLGDKIPKLPLEMRDCVKIFI